MDTSKLKGLWEKIKDFFKNMSKKLRIILAAALAVILIAIIVLAVVLNNKPYTALYQDMTPSEIQEVTTYLQGSGFTDYQVVNNTIMVPNNQYASLIAQLAQQGYPKDGTLYGSYWDNVGSMSTTSERATAFLISTQERLETSIRTFAGVLDAQVYITPGESRTYVLEDVSTATTAAVHLTLRSGYTLPDSDVDAIQRLVSHAWSGMTVESVSITDNMNNTYTGSADVSAADSLELQRMLQEREANRIRREVKNSLDVLYGEENVRVAVGVTVDVSRRYTESTYYHQPDGSYENGGLIGTELGQYWVTRDGLEPVGGVVGTTANSDLPTYVTDLEQTLGDEDSAGYSYEKNNKIDETKEQREFLAPTISDVSVAVTINSSANPDAGVDVETLRSHVARAANIRGEDLAEWVSILVAPFPVEEIPEPARGLIPQEMVPYLIIAAAALLLLIVLIVVLISARRKKKRQQEEEDQRIIEEQLGELGASGVLSDLGIVPPLGGENGETPPPTSGADIMEINTEKSMELRKAVRQFVQNNPEVAALMLKTWLRGGDDDNG